jgi:hypothetical protein
LLGTLEEIALALALTLEALLDCLEDIADLDRASGHSLGTLELKYRELPLLILLRMVL